MHTGLELGLAILKQHQHVLLTIWRVVQSFLSKTNKTVSKLSETKFKVHSFTVPMYISYISITTFPCPRDYGAFPLAPLARALTKVPVATLSPWKVFSTSIAALRDFFVWSQFTGSFPPFSIYLFQKMDVSNKSHRIFQDVCEIPMELETRPTNA